MLGLLKGSNKKKIKLSNGDSSMFGYQNNRKRGSMDFPWQFPSYTMLYVYILVTSN